MNEELLKKAECAMKFLADKMGVASEAFWPTFIRKHVMDAIVVFVWLAIWIPVAVHFAPICFSWPATAEIGDYNLDFAKWFMRGVGLLLCLIALNTIHDAIDQIKYLGNLKYWALKDFIETLGTMIHGGSDGE